MSYHSRSDGTLLQLHFTSNCDWIELFKGTVIIVTDLARYCTMSFKLTHVHYRIIVREQFGHVGKLADWRHWMAGLVLLTSIANWFMLDVLYQITLVKI